MNSTLLGRAVHPQALEKLAGTEQYISECSSDTVVDIVVRLILDDSKSTSDPNELTEFDLAEAIKMAWPLCDDWSELFLYDASGNAKILLSPLMRKYFSITGWALHFLTTTLLRALTSPIMGPAAADAPRLKPYPI